MATYKTEINSLEIKKTILANTLDLFIPNNQYNEFRAKIKAINDKIDYYKALTLIEEIGDKEAYYIHRKIKLNSNVLLNLCHEYKIRNYDILAHELKANYIDYCDMYNS